MITENIPSRSGFSSSRAFHPWSRTYRSPSGSLANYIFVGSYWTSNPVVRESRDLNPAVVSITKACVVCLSRFKKLIDFWLHHTFGSGSQTQPGFVNSSQQTEVTACR